jgi:heme exporter protein A
MEIQGGLAIELNAIARRFGRRWALRGIDLRVGRGETVAITGRNGSGKTTLLRICATLLRPTRGSGRILGLDLVDQAPAIRASVGFLAHHAGLYDDLTADENLRFAARMLDVPDARRVVSAALERTGLLEQAAERVRGFSSGMRRRLALARLILRPPALLLLDEPYASFDADGVALVNGFVAQVTRAGGAALIATHDSARARDLIIREVVLEEGRLQETGPANASPALWPVLGGG